MARSHLNIVHVITRIDRGGSAEVVMDIAARQQAMGHTVTLATGRSEDPQEEPALYAAHTGVEVIELPRLQREVHPWRDLRALLAVRKLIRQRQPDIVHTHTSKAGIVGRAAAWRAGAKAVVHSPHGHIFYGYYGRVKTKLFIFLERGAARLCDRITTLTDLGARDHVELGIAPPERFVTIRPGVDLRRFAANEATRLAAREDFGYSPDARVVGWVGRLAPVKDCATFLRACAKVSGAEVMIAGDGPLRQELQSQAEQLGVSAAFLGNRSDVPRVMAAMDIFVLSSANEGFGRVLVEAMAGGLPIVATSVGGVPEVVEDGRTGALVPPGDDGAMARAIQTLLDDPDRAAAFGQAGKQRAQQFSIEQTVEDIERLYEEILAGSS